MKPSVTHPSTLCARSPPPEAQEDLGYLGLEASINHLVQDDQGGSLRQSFLPLSFCELIYNGFDIVPYQHLTFPFILFNGSAHIHLQG